MSDELIRWYPVAPIDEARTRAPLVVEFGGREIAVFLLEDGFRAIDNSCPHAGGPLAEGLVEGDVVECPWHGWSFDLNSGACRTAPTRAANTYLLRERDGTLEVGVRPR